VAIWSLRQHLERLPNDTYSRYELAQRYVQYGAHMAAIAEYRKLLCIDPHHYAARLALADCYLALEQWHEAAQELRLLTLVSSYAPKAWQRLVVFDQQISHPLASLEAAAQQHVWDMLYA
jgi:predicted Zn-dependent protease